MAWIQHVSWTLSSEHVCWDQILSPICAHHPTTRSFLAVGCSWRCYFQGMCSHFWVYFVPPFSLLLKKTSLSCIFQKAAMVPQRRFVKTKQQQKRDYFHPNSLKNLTKQQSSSSLNRSIESFVLNFHCESFPQKCAHVAIARWKCQTEKQMHAGIWPIQEIPGHKAGLWSQNAIKRDKKFRRDQSNFRSKWNIYMGSMPCKRKHRKWH